MANGDQDTSLKPPLIADIAEAVVSKIVSVENIERLAKGNENGLIAAFKIILGTLLGAAGALGATAADVIVGAEEVADPAFQRLMQVAFKDITGVDMGGAPATPGGRGARAGAAQSLGAALMTAIAGSAPGGGQGGALEPSQAPAQNYVTWVTQLALEGWLTGVIGECVTLGQVESLGELDDALANTLGLGRMTRAVMRPLLDAKVITPFRWQVNKSYRPELLSAGEVARQVARGRWTRDKGVEELARQGYSDERIEALLNGTRKFFSASDVRQFVTRGHWNETAGLQHLKDQGYEPDAAEDALRLEGLRRIEQLEAAEAAAIIGAYASGDIDRATFNGMLSDAVTPPSERALLTELAEVRRGLHVTRLSISQVEAMVKSGVAAVTDYRAAARRAGYPEHEVLLLELQLRWELQREKDVEEARRQAAADRAAEQQARDDARAARRAEIEAERALARRGAENDLERAVVRGLIPIARLEELYAARYDADTVGILVELVEDDRLAYIAQQERRAEALQRGERRGLNAGDVEQAFMTNVLTLQELRARLLSLGFDAGDADVLTATAAARKSALDAARRRHDEAGTRAAARAIDLGRFEQLVRRGARSLAQYDELLGALGFDDAARAGMVELLELKVADDTRAREERAAGETRLRPRGLSLEQFRRGVLLGLRTPADFDRFLVENRFTADAHALLMEELRVDLEEAEAARRRRAEAAARVGARELSLDTVIRAARLGAISPDAFVARLERAGFTEDDVALQLELLLLEIADVQAARARRDAAEQDAQTRGLSLAEVERAVKLGVQSVEDYRARAAALNYSPDAVNDLVAILELELAQLVDARARRETIGSELAARNLSIGQLEEAVTKGFRTLDDYVADVLALGYGSDDAELLAALLAVDLEASGG